MSCPWSGSAGQLRRPHRAGRQKLEEAAKIHVRNLERVFADYTSDETLNDLLDRLPRRDRERPADEAAHCATPGDASAPSG
ncbi:hypothetical protein DLE60_28035 [Micromonospora globispora]|nr:hypothetical protein DLE60_28035 [Micromonospora globispora]RQW91851.1 hypothetical protein DKL51_20405 [Micromonospora globispora]